MGKTTYGIMLQKLKEAFIAALIISGLLLIAWGQRIFNSYITGFLIGSLNLLMLSIELNILINKNPRKIPTIHFLFFVLRYLIIFYVIYRGVSLRDLEAFSIFAGLFTINVTIVVTPLIKHALDRGEG